MSLTIEWPASLRHQCIDIDLGLVLKLSINHHEEKMVAT